MNNLWGKSALITGGASGIGRATALLFAAEGASIAIADLNAPAGSDVVRQISGQGGRAVFVPCDVARAQDCERTVLQTVEQLGRLDILLNNAGIIRRAAVTETEEEDWDRVLAVNLKSVFLLSKYAIPVMAQGGGGTIINISSGWGLVGGRKAASYCASKGGVVLLTKAMALDHAPQNIRVNCICPGDTDTPMMRNEATQLGESAEAFLGEAARRPLGRIGKPEDIARAALFLAGDDSSFVTGTTLVVDGGGLAG
ncbi:MAG: glucose 1-dehydrogenase [Acidobacteriota bacterium]|jgi:NAD(P)-dependent dehydrogenase (short-subunit alcohol dehydrogenase family)